MLEHDGVLASIVPAASERSVANGVTYDSRSQLAAALDGLAAAYAEADVKAWTVWVPGRDREAADLLERAGHRLDAAPAAMWRELDGIPRPADGDLEDWTAEGDPAVMAELCDRSYGFGDHSFAAAFATLPSDVHVYLATRAGEPVACLLTSDLDGNCDVEMVAVVPEARGHGLARGLLAHALVDARERGCTTTTLVSTKAGYPTYQRLGYRDLGPIEMWERRRP